MNGLSSNSPRLTLRARVRWWLAKKLASLAPRVAPPAYTERIARRNVKQWAAAKGMECHVVVDVDRASDAGLECPAPGCDQPFYDYHDESALTTLVYHLDADHPELYRALKRNLGGDTR